MFEQPKEIRIHLGAHKTATTHLQDSLALTERELRNNGIFYLPREKFRERIKKACVERKLKRLWLPFLKRAYLSQLLMSGCKRHEKLIISEENILGNCAEACALDPYCHTYPSFIRILSNLAPTTLYLSIRSFDKVFPGAYATGLRFVPQYAISQRRRVLRQLEAGAMPSWIPLISRLRTQYPNADLKIWCQEEYALQPQFFINEFLGTCKVNIPAIGWTYTTATPNFKGVELVEKMFSDAGFDQDKVWPQRCKEIFDKYRALPGCEKYSFLNAETQRKLKEFYLTELDTIKKRWPDSFITGGDNFA